jgi:hypothetical protein
MAVAAWRQVRVDWRSSGCSLVVTPAPKATETVGRPVFCFEETGRHGYRERTQRRGFQWKARVVAVPVPEKIALISLFRTTGGPNGFCRTPPYGLAASGRAAWGYATMPHWRPPSWQSFSC